MLELRFSSEGSSSEKDSLEFQQRMEGSAGVFRNLPEGAQGSCKFGAASKPGRDSGAVAFVRGGFMVGKLDWKVVGERAAHWVSTAG